MRLDAILRGSHREERSSSRVLPRAIKGLFPKPPLRAVQANNQINEVRAMGFFSKDIRTMDELFVHTLRDIYYAEQKILQALPTMIEDSAKPKLRLAFE